MRTYRTQNIMNVPRIGDMPESNIEIISISNDERMKIISNSKDRLSVIVRSHKFKRIAADILCVVGNDKTIMFDYLYRVFQQLLDDEPLLRPKSTAQDVNVFEAEYRLNQFIGKGEGY